MDIKPVLAEIKNLLTRIAPYAEVILYGSRARGDAREDSDFDLLILLPEQYEGRAFVKEQGRISDNLYDLSLDLGVDISTLIVPKHLFFKKKTPFTINVKNEGIVL